MKLLRRLLKEFWLPALVALAWTSYNVWMGSTPMEARPLVNLFAPSFFLVSWATGQFFRVQKQTHVEENLSSIEDRLKGLVTKLEKHTQDFLGHATGEGSLASFTAMKKEGDVVELALINTSAYPVFDIYAELINLNEPVDLPKGKFWTRHIYSRDSLYPNKLAEGAYRFDMRNRDSLSLQIFIRTRSQVLTQQFRMVKNDGRWAIAVQTICGDQVVERKVPDNFPGVDPNDPDAIFR